MTDQVEKNLQEPQTQTKPHVHGPGCNHHHHHRHDPFVRASAKIGRNDPCPCESGQKFKKCCGKSQGANPG